MQVAGFDDGSFSCLAQVSEGDESFTVRAGADSLVKLQFYSAEWDFGEGDTADPEVEADRRTPWTLNAVELHLQSVLFTLPDSDIGSNSCWRWSRATRCICATLTAMTSAAARWPGPVHRFRHWWVASVRSHPAALKPTRSSNPPTPGKGGGVFEMRPHGTAWYSRSGDGLWCHPAGPCH